MDTVKRYSAGRYSTAGRQPRARKTRAGIAIATTVVTLLAASVAAAGAREQARRLHDRIAGVPPSDAVLTQMASLISGGNAAAAAALAETNPNFYNVTLRNFAAVMTNRDQSVFVPLNDYTATVIGMIRDDVDYTTVLSADLVYVASTAGAPAYSPANNNHYQYLDDNAVDLSTALQPQTQSGLLGLPVAATAGVMTTRAAAAAFFINGTNRAMFRFTMINHLCHDMETVLDITQPPDRIRQDVSRSPGGDSRIFLNSCIGCHSGMDPLVQSFAYYNFDTVAQQLVYTQGAVQAKYHINANNFPSGYNTQDDHWDNYWRTGQNSALGWSSTLPGTGNGAKSMGQELANSDAFAQCQVVKVFRTVCLRDPTSTADQSAVATIKAKFVSTGHKMKQVFADAAISCMGQ